MTRSLSHRARPTRRQFLQRATATLSAPLLAATPFGALLAQEAAPSPQVGFWREFGALASEAGRLGFGMPRFSATLSAADGSDFGQVMRATVDLIETVQFGQPAIGVQANEVERLDRKAHSLLRRVTQVERNMTTDREASNSIAAMPSRPTFESIKDDYDKLFASCKIRDKNASEVAWYVTKLSDARYQKLWLEAAQEVCAPWYFVAIIHAMEASFDFKAHLHNGDPLSEQTVQVPAKRPPKWNPPSDWVSSAKDALQFDGFADQQDWSVARTLYRWEAYNGFRSRRNGINTPYLWSFTNHYAKGKYVADGVWDPNAVSKQCGAATMLKALVEKGLVAPPA